MKNFLEAIEKNEELKAKVGELNEKRASAADFSALAREYGFDLTEEDFSGIGQDEGELSEDELDAVAGGHMGTIEPISDCIGGPRNHKVSKFA